MPIEPGKPAEMHYEDQGLTKARLLEMLPKKSKHLVTDETMKIIYSMEEDIDVLQSYMEESLLSNLNVIAESKISMKEYINAVKYVALRQNLDSIKAYSIVFPAKYKQLMDKKKSGKPVNEYNYSSAYEKSTAVQKISAQAMVLPNLLSSKFNMEAKNKMYKLMNGVGAHPDDYISGKVQLDAAIGLEAATRPERDNTLKIELGQSDAALEQQKLMNENIANLVARMQEGISKGEDLSQLQRIHVNIIDTDVIE